MTDFLVALALILVIEGALYALFPEGMKRMMMRLIDEPTARIRAVGLVAAAVGVLAVWLVRG